ncbi:MAG: hypothetical protein ACQETR_15630 [Thermodesulfobacteriota bacterium]
MKKLLWVTLTVLLIIFLVPPAFSGGDFSAFDYRHCPMIEDKKFCVDFQQLPFGPGYVGEAFLVSSEAYPIVGPVPEKREPLGKVFSRDGFTLEFEDLGLKGRFDEGGLDVFNLLLRFYKER